MGHRLRHDLVDAEKIAGLAARGRSQQGIGFFSKIEDGQQHDWLIVTNNRAEGLCTSSFR